VCVWHIAFHSILIIKGLHSLVS